MRPTTALTARTTTHEFDTQLPHPADDVWDWHTRPGAVVRLTPGFARMRVRSEASDLRDGTTTFSLPGRLPGKRAMIRRVSPKGAASSTTA